VYVSSCSVYADDAMPGTGEEAAVHPAHEGAGSVDAEVYGPAKVACEVACLSAMGAEHTAIARSGLIGGYGDLSDRLGYWAARVARATKGSPVLVPPLDTPVQVIDVEDLAAWLVDLAERRVAGVFNALGDVATLRDVLDACAVAAGHRPAYVEVSERWLAEHEVQPWSGPASLPVWLPREKYSGFMTRRNDAARATGLRLRPLEETLASALRWERKQGLDRERRAGLTSTREAELLVRTPEVAGQAGD
jgi:nucleoside-diphosphate-sugar epimerase